MSNSLQITKTKFKDKAKAKGMEQWPDRRTKGTKLFISWAGHILLLQQKVPTTYFTTRIAAKEQKTFLAMADPKVIIPCVLILSLLRLYLRRRRRNSPLIAPQPFVSRRALHILRSPQSPPCLHLQNPYDAHTNPDGVICMASDQNHLCIDLINARLKEIAPNSTSYAIANTQILHPDGIPALKNAVAGYIARLTGKNVLFDPSRVVITAAAAAAAEILSFCVAESKGDAILVPSPYNPSYDKSIGWRSGAELVHIPCRSSDDFEITAAALARGLRACKFRRLIPRAILFSNPCNPTGNSIHRENLLTLLKFAEDEQIHVICDETQTQAADPEDFAGIAEILDTENIQRDIVHVIYDVGIAGFDVGVIYTYNDRIVEAAKEFGRGCAVSGDAQSLVAAVVSEGRFVEQYVRESRRRVRERFGKLCIGLQRAGVRCLGGGGGVFCWGEVERLLGAYSEKGEAEVAKEMVEEAGICATPGGECHCIEPGWFRWGFGRLSAEEMAVGLRRIRDFVRRRRQRHLQGGGQDT